MSAYALSGSFSFVDSNRRRKETIQHGDDDKLTNTKTTTTTTTTRRSSPSLEHSLTVEKKTKTKTTSELLVTIQSATIDPLRYIQFFQKNPTYSRPRRWNHPTTIHDNINHHQPIEEEEEDDDHYIQTVEEDEDDADDCYNYSDTSYPSSMNDCSNSQSHDDDCSSNDSSTTSGVEDAIHFHLSVSFCGRTYTAKRTLPSFQKLRNELIQEIGSKTTTAPNRSTHSKNYCNNVSIPELPKTTSSDLLGISGLSNIQEAITSFVCPAMESWLRNVAEQLPSSPSLCKFLWEPLSYVSSSSKTNNHHKNNHNQKKSSRPSMKSLNNSLSSIHEYIQHEEEEESGW